VISFANALLTAHRITVPLQIASIIHSTIKMGSYLAFASLTTKYSSPLSTVVTVCFIAALYLLLNIHQFVGFATQVNIRSPDCTQQMSIIFALKWSIKWSVKFYEFFICITSMTEYAFNFILASERRITWYHKLIFWLNRFISPSESN
jgi:hypothetical protein